MAIATQNPFPEMANPGGFQRISGTCSEYDTIRLEIGNHVHQSMLVSVPTVGQPLQFYLTYNSQETVLGPVGAKWRHNLMARLEIVPTLVRFFGADGLETDFVVESGAWVQSDSLFLNANLTNPFGDTWRLTYFPSGDFLEFDGEDLPGYPGTGGRLVRIVDNNDNALTLSYSDGQLSALTEPEPGGRQLLFGYTDDLLTSVKDPNGNEYLLGFDGDSNLTTITGPEGCILTYGYSIPSNNLITSRQDALGNTYTYTFDGSERLISVTDPETPPNTITYSYDTVVENLGDPAAGSTAALLRTTLVDARGQTWAYHFDTAGNLWRVIDPLGHQKRFYWGPLQRPLYATAGYANPGDSGLSGPRDNLNNRFLRFQTDDQANALLVADATGILTAYTYDEGSHPTSVTPGVATMAVQGNWFGEFGGDGYVLCSFEDATADLVQMPSYVAPSGILNGGGGGVNPFTRVNLNTDPSTPGHLLDPRALVGRIPGSPDRATYQRALGFWEQTGEATQFSFRIPLQVDQAFNLSLYSSSVDLAYNNPPDPLVYGGQFGRGLQFVINDTNPATGLPRQQQFDLPNNAYGVWLTFQVYGTPTQPVTVTVTASGGNTVPILSAVAFDPLQSRTTNLVWDTKGNLLSVTDPLLETTQVAYLSNGLPYQVTDALSHVTELFYEDAYLNLTKIQDALLNITHLNYDLNGNLVYVLDPENHPTSLRYDGKNRLISVTDALGLQTLLVYDAVGNLIQVIDPRGLRTELYYTPSRRLSKIIDAAGNQTLLTYDPAGNLSTVTDPRGNLTQILRDACGRISQVIRPDTTQVQYTLDAINRLVALTTPNGNLSDLTQINLKGARNRLQDPGAEEVDPYDPAQTRPRYWTNSVGANARSTTVSHNGVASFPMALAASASQYWTQGNLNLYPGGRYVMNQWASKAADGVSAEVWMSGLARDFSAVINELAGATTTLPGTTTDWTQTALARVDLPGDAQFTLTNAAVSELRTYAENLNPSLPTEVWVDDLQLLGLSIAVAYDGERLREIGTPDGARLRLERDRFGRVEFWVDPQGRRTQILYDGLDRVIGIVDPLGNSVSYSYDAVGNLQTFTDPNSNVTTYGYDAISDLLISG